MTLGTRMAEAPISGEPATRIAFEQTLQALDLMAYELTGRALSALALNRRGAESPALLERQGQKLALPG